MANPGKHHDQLLPQVTVPSVPFYTSIYVSSSSAAAAGRADSLASPWEVIVAVGPDRGSHSVNYTDVHGLVDSMQLQKK